MLIKLQLKKSLITNWLMGSFVFILVVSGLFSEFFQAPGNSNPEFERYRTLYNDQDFQSVTSLKIENRIGIFKVTKEQDSIGPQWFLQSPRELPADASTLEKVFETLSDIKIRRVYTKDQINISNFSLNSPLVRIEYQDPIDGLVVVSLGLVNPVDNSTYITASNKEAIYHVESIKNSIELLGLSDFVDSRVVSLNPENVSRLELYRGSIENDRNILTIERTPTGSHEWIGKTESEDLPLETSKVKGFLESLTNMRSQFILDRRTEELDAAIDNTLRRPQYSFKVYNLNGEYVSYETSSVLSQTLPDLRLEPNQSFVIRASNRQHPYVVHRENLDVFDMRQDELKKLPFNKLFY